MKHSYYRNAKGADLNIALVLLEIKMLRWNTANLDSNIIHYENLLLFCCFWLYPSYKLRESFLWGYQIH
jgi:hypothetical protein